MVDLKPYQDVVIVGGGPSGLLLALTLLRRTNNLGQPIYPKITLVERGGDPQKSDLKVNCSYGLGLSHRAILPLKTLEIYSSIAMCGEEYRDMRNCVNHDNLDLGLFSTTKDLKLSIERTSLTQKLCEILMEKYGSRVYILFDYSCIQVDFEQRKIYLRPTLETKKSPLEQDPSKIKSLPFSILIGCDGVHSQVMSSLRRSIPFKSYIKELGVEPFFSAKIPRTEFTSLNLTIPTKSMFTCRPKTKNGNLVVLPYPHHLGMTLVLRCYKDKVNPKGYEKCTCTLDNPHQLEEYLTLSYPNLAPVLFKYFKEQLFPDGEIKVFPKCRYTKSQMDPYHHPTVPCVGLGDAVHGMVPFVGQGINAAFEDVTVLDGLLDKYQDDWTIVPKAFSEERVQDGNAIIALNDRFNASNFGVMFFLGLMFDFVRNKLNSKTGNYFQLSTNQMLSQTSMRYSEVLKENKRQLYMGIILASLAMFSVGYTVYWVLGFFW